MIKTYVAFHLFHFTLFCCILACSTKCYFCQSMNGLDGCLSIQTEETCSSDIVDLRCITANVNHNQIKMTVKRCAPATRCSTDSIQICAREGVECEVNCCSGNLCNP